MRTLVLGFLTAVFFITTGAVSLQTSVGTPSDLQSVITTVGQYGLLTWLIIRAESRQSEQQKYWREERKWLISLVVTEKKSE